jgi:hypothetical protein
LSLRQLEGDTNRHIENMAEAKLEAKLSLAEQQITALKEELDVAKAAKKVGEVCDELLEYSSQLDDPFHKAMDEPNQWHKNPGGGGCVIL